MFHMVNLTPEAPSLEAVCADGMARGPTDVDGKIQAPYGTNSTMVLSRGK